MAMPDDKDHGLSATQLEMEPATKADIERLEGMISQIHELLEDLHEKFTDESARLGRNPDYD